MRRVLLLLPILWAAGCATPPPQAYVDAARASDAQDLGANATGETCRQLAAGNVAAEIYCKASEQPVGTVRAGGAAGPGDLPGLAVAGEWRKGIDLRFVCEPPVPARLAHAQAALVLRCVRRVGGWPQTALVASVDGKAWFADGVPTVLPVLERSIGVLSGHVPATAAPTMPVPVEMARQIDRLAARAFTTGDVSDYNRLMALGARANLAEDFRSAAIAYRAALKLQQRALGQDYPGTADATMSLALQISNEGHFGEAEPMFAAAGRLAARAADKSAPARAIHYRALHLLNQDRTDDALTLLTEAEQAYTRLVPPETARGRPGGDGGGGGGAGGSGGGTGVGSVADVPSQKVLTDPALQTALIGLVEVHRHRAIALRKTGRTEEAQSSMRDAERLARANALVQPILGARVARTGAQLDATEQDSAAAARKFDRASANFRLSVPLSRPFAVTELLQAGIQMRDGDVSGTIEHCRVAVQVLRDLKLGAEPALLEPCLAAFSARAESAFSGKQAVLAEMFEVAALGQGSTTSQLIAQASARLQQSSRDPRIAKAIRRRQDSAELLASLYRLRDTAAQASQPGGLPYDGPKADLRSLDARIAAAVADFKDSDAVLQEAAPNYGQLVQQVVSANEILSLLHPGEAFAQVTVGSKETWTLMLRDGKIALGRSETGLGAMTRFVVRLRGAMKRAPDGSLPPFPPGPAHAVYKATLGTVAAEMSGATALVVMPSGPLLSLPFALLMTQPFDDTDLRAAPWLVRDMSLAYVPSPANFAGMRRAAATSRAGRPWFGFGDFRPVTLAAAERSFSGPGCQETAAAFAGMAPLPRSRDELELARSVTGAAAGDRMLGSAFTAEAVRRAPLKDYRIVHIATHALLPSELECQPQPLIVTSAPGGAASADGAMFMADDAMGLDLDAEAVILSACNSGGRGGKLAGESLSALARAFFYAGSRSLLATHWHLNDTSGHKLVTNLLSDHASRPDRGLAQSLRTAQLALLASAGVDGMPVVVAHPFFWAPMALIGEGGARGSAAVVARAP